MDVLSNEPQTILVVDDDESIRRMLKTGIQMSGFQCYVAEGGSSALKVLDQHSVAVVVADIKMPDMNGLELGRIIKSRYEADLIIMTGYVEDFNYEDIVQQGASDFIQKPVRIAEFIARLKRVLSERVSKTDRLKALADLKLNLGKLQRAMEGIVQAISVAVEMRDPYTAGHQQRVADLAAVVAMEMGLSADDIYGLRMASVIHDLGKITVPAGILAKPGRLSELEYELIKNHVRAGYDILKQIEFPWPLANIILQHHERMDGSGYPQGLKNGEIMMQARILAVADVFETIASHRPYRPSLGLQRAVDELVNNKGIQFDDQVVEVFLKLVSENRFPEFEN
ncbi:MAG: response regulator [Desulfobacteraceae bacterium]|nr:MAG: response regulator [Desulfobacteraceae bacterium]